MRTTPTMVRVFRNAVRRPVELHLPGGTTVLLPGQTIELPDDEPYCRGLVTRGVLTRHQRPEPEPREATPRSRARKKSPASTRSRASAKPSTGGGATTSPTSTHRPATKRTPPRDTNGTDTDRTAGEHP